MAGRLLQPQPDVEASMGPRLFSRGNSEEDFGMSEKKFSFNGATTFQPWKSVS